MRPYPAPALCRPTRILLVLLAGVGMLPAPRAVAADDKPILRDVLLRTYVHGVNDAQAEAVVSAADLPKLRSLLGDPGFPRRDNVVAFLAHRDGDAAVAPILAFLADPPAGVTTPEEDRALLLAPRALGHLARRGSPLGLDALLRITAGAGASRSLLRAAERGSAPKALLGDLVEQALWGLAISEAPAARNRIAAIADGRIELGALPGAGMRAREILATVDTHGKPNDAGTPGDVIDRAAPAPQDGSTVEGSSPLDAPGHAPEVIDTQSFSHDRGITWANHAALTDPVTSARAKDILRGATVKAARADYVDDVACCMAVSRSGTALTFGTVADGLDVVDTLAEKNSVMGNNVARVKVVRAINYCTSPSSNVLGCANTPGSTMMVVRLSNLDTESGVWMHEYGHNAGLPHSTDPRAIMYAVLLEARTLSQAECNSYHASATVTTGACGDPDGDGVAGTPDNCPSLANTDQGDLDGDGIGNACDPDWDVDGDGVQDHGDNCPGVANPGQQNTDGDAFGDLCDPCPLDAQNDTDGDGFCGNVDNCPSVPNLDQADLDGDGIGDACDPDADGDAAADASDNCPGLSNPGQQNSDGDSRGDACDPCPLDPLDDADGDGLCSDADNCPDLADPDQTDWDLDGMGNPCDSDREGDQVANAVDNCPDDANPLQEDRDRDGIGNACDQIRTVDDDGAAQYRGIQLAIDAASAGDIVVVMPGVYHEFVDMRSDIDLIGPGGSLATIDGADQFGVRPLVHFVDQGAPTRLSGFRLTNLSSPPVSYGSAVSAGANAHIVGNLVEGGPGGFSGGIVIAAGGAPGFSPAGTPGGFVADNVLVQANNYEYAAIVVAGVDGVQIRHNTIIGSPGSTVSGIYITNSNLSEVSHNIVVNDPQSAGFCYGILSEVASEALVLEFNDVHGGGCTNYWLPGDVDPTGTNGNVSVPPGFVNPAVGDYTLAPISPLIDAGALAGIPPRDPSGTPRPLEGDGATPARSDIGAFERISGDADGDGIPNATDRCPYVGDPAQADTDADGIGNLCDNCPAAANPTQRDLDRDGVGDACDNCPVTENPDQSDAIGFGVGDACPIVDSDIDSVPDTRDCEPLDPGAYFVPGEVRNLRVARGTVTLSWTPPDSGVATTFDVAGGLLGQLRSDAGFARSTCLGNDGPAGGFQDPRPNPSAGNGYYYVVRAGNACGIGTYGPGRAFLDGPATGPCP